MSFKNRDEKIPMARCQQCDSDLVASKHTGKVYCSNMKCPFVRKAHPTGSEPNAGTSTLNK